MNTLEFLADRFKVDVTQSLIELPIGRWKGLTYLLKDMGFNKGVEMGVYRGEYAEALKRANPDLDLVGIDAWKVYKGYKDYTNPDLEHGVYEEAQERANKAGFKLIKGFSLDVVGQFADESLDFVFIDGNHDFRHVVDDVDEWSKKVRKGGLVAGHDFYKNPHQGFGVREALPAWCEYKRIKPLFGLMEEHCPSWMYVKGAE